MYLRGCGVSRVAAPQPLGHRESLRGEQHVRLGLVGRRTQRHDLSDVARQLLGPL